MLLHFSLGFSQSKLRSKKASHDQRLLVQQFNHPLPLWVCYEVEQFGWMITFLREWKTIFSTPFLPRGSGWSNGLRHHWRGLKSQPNVLSLRFGVAIVRPTSVVQVTSQKKFLVFIIIQTVSCFSLQNKTFSRARWIFLGKLYDVW